MPAAVAAVALDHVQFVAARFRQRFVPRRGLVQAEGALGQRPERRPRARRRVGDEAAFEITRRRSRHPAAVGAERREDAGAALAAGCLRGVDPQERAGLAEGVVVAGGVGERPAAEVAAARLVAGVAGARPVAGNRERAVEVVGEGQLHAHGGRRVGPRDALVPDHPAAVEKLEFADVLLPAIVLGVEADRERAVGEPVRVEDEAAHAIRAGGEVGHHRVVPAVAGPGGGRLLPAPGLDPDHAGGPEGDGGVALDGRAVGRGVHGDRLDELDALGGLPVLPGVEAGTLRRRLGLPTGRERTGHQGNDERKSCMRQTGQNRLFHGGRFDRGSNPAGGRARWQPGASLHSLRSRGNPQGLSSVGTAGPRRKVAF